MQNKFKQDIINTLLFARRDWDRLLAEVDEVTMAQPGVCGDWSIKDLIPHVTWYEKEMVDLLNTCKLEGSQLWELDTDARNETIYRENQFRSLDDVKDKSLRVFAHLLTALENINPQALLDPQLIEGMPSDWTLMEVLAENTWGHYEVHAGHIKEFMKR